MDPTERTTIGRGVEVTRLALGTVPIAGLYEAVSEEQAQATLERAWSLGVRFFDTAPLYGYGLGEQRLGRFLAGVPRDEAVVSTKVGRLLREQPTGAVDAAGRSNWADPPDLHVVWDFSYDGARRSFEESLERLGLDRVEIVLIHDPDDAYDEALSGAYRALDELRSQGVIGAVGCGMNQSAMLTRLAQEGDFDCFLLAGRYTLLDQSGLADLLPVALERGVRIVAGGVFNSGILGDPRGHATFNYAPADRAWVDKALAIEAVCERHGVPLQAAALQFPLSHPAVAVVLTGVRSPAEIEQNERLFRHPIPDELWAELRAEGLLPAAVAA
jgi:D-threo-aldose 1-dehydrogenase